MKRISKKIIGILATITLFCFASLNISAEAISTTTKVNYVKQVLIQEGVPENVVEKMSTTVKLNMYEKMQNYDFYISDVEEKIVSFENTQDEKSATTYATIPESKMSITSMYTNYVTGNKVESVECYYYSEWLSGPTVNGTDGLAMNWDSSLFSLDGFAAYPAGKIDGIHVDFNTITRPASATQGGYGINIPLFSQYFNQSVEMLTAFTPRNTLYTTSNITSNINYEYGHETIGITPSVSFSTTDKSVNIQPTIGLDTAAEVITYYSNRQIVNEDW